MSELILRVCPKSSQRKLECREGAWKAWVHEPAADDAANKAVCRLLAEALSVPVSAVSIMKGHASREKVLSIPSLSVEEIRNRLNSFVDSYR